jgi:hypothetical protein
MFAVGEHAQEEFHETDDQDEWTCGLWSVSSQLARDSVEMINEMFEFRELVLSQVDRAPDFPRLTLKSRQVNFQTVS